MRKTKIPYIRDLTPEEDAKIRADIATDPDTWEIPADAVPLRVGRPAGETKQQVTVRLDIDLVRALKQPDPKGWQTRLNAAARAGMKLD